MARKRPVIREVSYGLYERFDAEAKTLPKHVEFTGRVPPEAGQEFGFILNLKQARGLTIDFKIDHPRIPDPEGKVMPPFRGEVFVLNSDFDFFLGDALWEPIEQMLGPWTLSCRIAGRPAHRRVFDVALPPRVPDWNRLPMQ
jgi:hypothetical protein